MTPETFAALLALAALVAVGLIGLGAWGLYHFQKTRPARTIVLAVGKDKSDG